MLDVVEGNRKFLERLGGKEEELPTVRFAYSLHKKYSPKTDDMSEVHIRHFINEVQSGRIQPNEYTKSEEVPEDWNSGPVKTLVGKNFYTTLETDLQTCMTLCF